MNTTWNERQATGRLGGRTNEGHWHSQYRREGFSQRRNKKRTEFTLLTCPNLGLHGVINPFLVSGKGASLVACLSIWQLSTYKIYLLQFYNGGQFCDEIYTMYYYYVYLLLKTWIKQMIVEGSVCHLFLFVAASHLWSHRAGSYHGSRHHKKMH